MESEIENIERFWHLYGDYQDTLATTQWWLEKRKRHSERVTYWRTRETNLLHVYCIDSLFGYILHVPAFANQTGEATETTRRTPHSETWRWTELALKAKPFTWPGREKSGSQEMQLLIKHLSHMSQTPPSVLITPTLNSRLLVWVEAVHVRRQFYSGDVTGFWSCQTLSPSQLRAHPHWLEQSWMFLFSSLSKCSSINFCNLCR